MMTVSGGLQTLAIFAESLRGALAARAIERFGIDAGRLHVDLTMLRVAGACEDSALVAKGWGADRRVARQVRVLQATSACGVSLYVRPDPGNAAEVTLIAASLERLKELASPGLVICDAACGYPKTLAQIARSGLRFIVALRAHTGFRERYLTDVGPQALRALSYVAERQRDVPATQRTHYRGALRDWQITDPETNQPLGLRVAHIHSSEEAREVAAARARTDQGRRRAGTRAARPRRALLQDAPPRRRPRRQDPHRPSQGPDRRHDRNTRRAPNAHLRARRRRDQRRRAHGRHLRPGDQPPRTPVRQPHARALCPASRICDMLARLECGARAG